MNTAFLDNYRLLARYNRWMNQRLGFFGVRAQIFSAKG